ncbi:MAG: topoisomerase DNA-binding C4 zinc finger domain-containing protein [Bacillota bacterium]|nr:topoisomerase DNA-binding C4 zinc finger domain-containing protein [Bacillota bacterium]
MPIQQHKRWLNLEQKRRNRAPSCPSCSTKMVLRYSDYGWFWGCQRFPKCRGLVNLRPGDRDLL